MRLSRLGSVVGRRLAATSSSMGGPSSGPALLAACPRPSAVGRGSSLRVFAFQEIGNRDLSTLTQKNNAALAATEKMMCYQVRCWRSGGGAWRSGSVWSACLCVYDCLRERESVRCFAVSDFQHREG